MNERQRLVEVRDQFALKNASDDTLKKILPSYRQAIDNIRTQLEFLPEGKIERELWLKTQLKTMERQFRQVANRIDDVLPPAQADQFLRALHNAQEYLEADGIKPAAAQQTALSGTTASGQTVTQTGNLPSIAGNDGFIQPSITRQQIEAASRTGGFSTFTLDDQVIKLEDVLPKWQKAQVANLERTLRTGFLLGQTNQEIMREFGPLGPGRKGWAMTEAVVRTGMAEASQAAHDAFFDANKDLLPKVPGGYRWEWDASNDTRLCPLCAPLDGMRYKTRDEMPAKPHWGCRCKKLPITATQAALRERGDVPEGSFLERKEVTYTNGKRNPAPAGYESVKRGGTAYARPQKIDGKMYWVRRRELPKGQTLAGDMIKRMDDKNKLAILGTKANVKEWNELIKLNAYKDDPQKLVRDLLGKGGRGPGRPPLPPKPPGSGPKPRPKTPAPKPAPAAAKPAPKPDTPKQTSGGGDRDYIEQHQWDNGKNKLSHKAIADSLELAAQEDGLTGQHMRQVMEFQRKKEIQTVWSTGREKLIGTKDFDYWGDTEIIAALRKGKGKGKEVVMAIADDLEKGKKHPFMNTIAKVSSGAAGHTIEASHLIVLKQETQFKQMTKASIARVRESVKNSVKASVDGKPVKLTGADLYKKTGKTTWKTEDGWINTYVHEMGHQVHFRAGKPSIGKYIAKDLGGLSPIQQHAEIKKRNWYPSQYGMTNEMEQFAETFTQYVFAPDELKKANPAAYKWVEDALKEALK